MSAEHLECISVPVAITVAVIEIWETIPMVHRRSPNRSRVQNRAVWGIGERILPSPPMDRTTTDTPPHWGKSRQRSTPLPVGDLGRKMRFLRGDSGDLGVSE